MTTWERLRHRLNEEGARGLLLALGRRLAKGGTNLIFPRWRKPFAQKPVKLSQVQTVLVIKLYGVGNLLLFTPALQTLRRDLPGAKIVLLSDGRALSVLEGSGLYDEQVILEGYPAVLGSPFFRLKLVRQLRRYHPDLILSSFPMGDPRLTDLFDLLGASWAVGYDLDGPAEKFSHRLRYDPHRHEVWCNLDLLQAIGLTNPVTTLWLSPQDSHHQEAKAFLGDHGGGPPWFAFHPGSYPDMIAKRWPLEKYAELGDLLVGRFGGRVIVVGGQEERNLAQGLAELMKAPPLDATGRLTLLGTAALLGKCQLLVTNDSGVMHLAAAMGTPLVALFGPTSHLKNHPWTDNYRLVRSEESCSPCYQVGKKITCPHVKCMTSISVEQVFEAIQSLLGHQLQERG